MSSINDTLNAPIIFKSRLQRYLFKADKNSMDNYRKTPTEVRPLIVDFSAELPYNNILDSTKCTVVAINLVTTVDASSTIIKSASTAVLEDGTNLMCIAQAGTDGDDYLVKFNGVSKPDGWVMEHKVLLQIRV